MAHNDSAEDLDSYEIKFIPETDEQGAREHAFAGFCVAAVIMLSDISIDLPPLHVEHAYPDRIRDFSRT